VLVAALAAALGGVSFRPLQADKVATTAALSVRVATVTREMGFMGRGLKKVGLRLKRAAGFG
jgi:hypothetical protein